MSIPSSITTLLHYPLDHVLRERLPIRPIERPLDQQHAGLAYFCAVDAILLYLFSAISSGLTVSFTLVGTFRVFIKSCANGSYFSFQSLFAVVVKSKHPSISTSPRTWQSFRWLWDPSTTKLCIAPFIWALPLVAVGIETLVRTSRDQYPSIYYSYTYCNIDDKLYQMVSAIILGLPIIIATGLIFAIFGLIICMAIKNRGRTSQSVNVPLALRFAAIVTQIFITAIFLLCEISLQDDQLRGVFDLHPYWTSITPLIFFFIFGTQRDLMAIWKYWAYRLAGKQPRCTPQSSNEGHTLCNSSTPATINTNDPHFVKMLGGAARRDGKVHRPSSSVGGRASGSIMDLYGSLGMKHSTDPSDLSNRTDRDIEAAVSRAVPERALSLKIPELSRAPGGPKTSSPTMSSGHAHFYSAPSLLSSQALVSSHDHSRARTLLTPQNNPSRPQPPFIVVTDGFGAVFGAQVPPNTHSGLMGRPIMTREERERRLALDEQQRRPRTEFGRQRTKSVGLPPPPRSPRQSNSRPSTAGAVTALEPNLRGGAGLGSGIASPWNWDSPFRSGPSASAQGVRDRASSDHSGSLGGSRNDSDLAIEMEEKIKTPSSGSFERGHVRHESHEGSLRTSWVSKDSRVSVASDRTFG
ncbi:hypothetical protein RSOLAG22IIIB_03691 [Rhizoctonia solani]|uniref:Uncharacterized protein n=1 Tax=Rhizoctonia solani TaxID=456999 RepID=A0A0K6FRG9_9AGAM|nr:hypothetical protein RSOLAG22IIIB_03691 [Rhizoctonia solani]